MRSSDVRLKSLSLPSNEYFYDSPPPCQRRFQNRFRAFSPSFLFFLLVRPVHADAIVNASLSLIFFFNLAACSGGIHYFLVHAIDVLGGAIVETLKHKPRAAWKHAYMDDCVAAVAATVEEVGIDAVSRESRTSLS